MTKRYVGALDGCAGAARRSVGAMRALPSVAVTSKHLGIVSVITAVTTFGYVVLLGQQGSLPGIDGRMALVITLLAGCAIASGIGAFARPAGLRAVIAVVCAAGLIAFGFLALFTIGAVLILAGVIALLAWGNAVRDSTDRRLYLWSAAAAVGTLGVLALGLAATG